LTWKELVRIVDAGGAIVVDISVVDRWASVLMCEAKTKITVYEIPHEVVSRLAGLIKRC